MKISDTIRLLRPSLLALALAIIALLARPVSAGSIERLIYYDANNGATLASLTNLPGFPTNLTPSWEEQLDDFTPPVYGFQSKQDSQYAPEGIGSFTRGYLEAPTNGYYIFFLQSVDASQLSLSTNETVAGLQIIAAQTNSGTLLFSGANLTNRESAPIFLIAGQKYYLELLHQSDTPSSSFVQVGWQRPDGVQEIIPTLHLAKYPIDPYTGENFTYPVLNGDGLNGGDLPASVATNEGASFILQADVIAAQPANFQWLSNSVPVPGANLSYLEFAPVHGSQKKAVYQFVVTNVFGALTSSPTELSITPDTTPPFVTQAGPLGYPNSVEVNFSKPVDPVTATTLANYVLQLQGGSSLVITSATLLAGQQSVLLTGSFDFQLGQSFQLTISGVVDQASKPNLLTPNPTVVNFTFAAPAGTLYNFNNGATSGFNLYGTATVLPSGSYDGGGFLELTTNEPAQEGVIQFTSDGTVDHLRLDFKTSIGLGSATPGDGFSIDLAADLPNGIFLNQQSGYVPLADPAGDRLSVAFDNDGTVNGLVTPAITVRWQGQVVTNVPVGVGGIPAITTGGSWVPVDLQLQRGGKLSLSYNGVVIFTNLATGFVPIPKALLEIAAQTGTNFETHWFDDINVNFQEGDIGPVAFTSQVALTNETVLENQTATFAVSATGTDPLYYQWYGTGGPIAGATNSVLLVPAVVGPVTSYWVVVSNYYNQWTAVTNPAVTLTVTPDTTPPQLLSARGLAGGLNEVVLTFSKPLNPATATNTATYNLGTVTVNAASLIDNGEVVTLSTSSLVDNQQYLFTINGLTDTTVAQNQLNTSGSFVTTVDYAAQVVQDGAIRYWRFDDEAGSPTVASLTTGVDVASLGLGTLTGSPGPLLGVTSLVPSEPQDDAVLFTAADNQYISVPNGADINTAGPYVNKSFEFWFYANSLPSQSASGLAATAGIFKEGAATRGVNIYLTTIPGDPNPNEGNLIFNAFDNGKDGGGAPWGVGSTGPAIYAQATIEAGRAYHVVAVLAGDATGFNGTLTLYLNGVAVNTVSGAGQLYAHTGNIEIGSGGTTTLDINDDSGALGNFDGVLDDLSLYNTALSSNTVALHYALGATVAVAPGNLAVSSVSTLGDPNQVLLTFNEPVAPATATNLANYILKNGAGTVLPITNITLFAGDNSLKLEGNFNFPVNSTNSLTVVGLKDQSVPARTISPNPTLEVFTFGAPTGTLYTFGAGLPTGLNLIGTGYVTNSGGYNNDAFADLTDAAQYESGFLQFPSPGTVDQFQLSFITSISGASAIPGDGFSITLANDLPHEAFLNAQAGYIPETSPAASRLIVAFDNDLAVNGVVTPAIVVKWLGVVITNVAAGVHGIPPINSADGHWAPVNLQLKRGGSLSLSFDGVVIFTNLATGYLPITDGQVEIAAQTSTNFETHWFDEINVNYQSGDIGPVAFVTNPSLTNLTVVDNNTANFAVIPSGASPFTYQWYFNGAAIPGANSSVLSVVGTPNTAGSYYVVVANSFSQATSAAATLTVTADTTAPQLLSARGFAGGVNQVVLTFNKPLNPASATNIATYNLGLLALDSASLGANGETVTLNTGTLENNQLYLFAINGLQDNTPNHNLLTTRASFIASVDYAAQVVQDSAVRYWRFDDSVGSTNVASLTTGKDALSLGVATLDGSPLPTLGVPSLIPGEPQDPALLLAASDDQYVSVPNGADINTATSYQNKSFEFWFYANSVPAPGTTGLAATAGLFKEGGVNRGVNLYLERIPGDANPDEAALVFNSFNNVASDGAGSPWGASAALAAPPIYVQTTVQAGQVYHVVGVEAGSTATDINGSFLGTLTLYVNGVPVATTNDVGLLYAHTGNVEIGAGGTSTLDINGDSGALGYFDGVLDDLSLYNTALSSNTVALHYQLGANGGSASGPLAVSRLDTLGNPNQILLSFNKPVANATATNLANYVLKKAGGAGIAITNATLLGGASTVQLSGSFGFLVNSNYSLTVSGVADQSANLLAPNPTNVAFAFSAPTGTLYAFNAGLPNGVQIYGSSYATNSGGPNGGGFVDLTDAITNENGALLFTAPHDIGQFDISFQAQLSGASTPPGAGFSVNIAQDLPAATFATPEKGYLPTASPAANRLVVSFDNNSNNPPSISVLWQGVVVTNVPAGTNGIPPLNNTNGHWANVDINLQTSGNISVSYDGTTVFTNVPTGYQLLTGARVGFGARTTTNAFETHWFNNINLNFANNSIGNAAIAVNGQPQSTTNEENTPVTLSVAPAGTGPFGYQWYFDNAPLPGANSRILAFLASGTNAGSYFAVVSNGFSSAASAVANVVVQTDLQPPALTNVIAYGGSLNEVILSFDKFLNPASATNLATYAFTAGGLAVNRALLGTNGNTVTLYTSQQQNLQTNTLNINGLLDQAVFPHPLYTSVTFQSGVSYYKEALSDSPVRYFRFDETNGTIANSDVSALDSLLTAEATYNHSPLLGLPPLVPNSTGTAVQLQSAFSNNVSFVATEQDLTATNSTDRAFTNRTVEFWFEANTLPAINGSVIQAPPLWIEGGASRYLAVYLYGTDGSTATPANAELVFNAGNLIKEFGGVGTPWGITNGAVAQNAVYVSATVTTGQVYHVVAVLKGNATPALGQLLLYTNGVLAGSTYGAGYLYTHTTAPRIGGGGNVGFRADGVSFTNSDYFNGEIDELSLYNAALSPARVAAHYQIGVTPPLLGAPIVLVQPAVFSGYAVSGGSFSLSWTGTAQLERATNVGGPYSIISGATSPYSESTTNKQAFFQLTP